MNMDWFVIVSAVCACLSPWNVWLCDTNAPCRLQDEFTRGQSELKRLLSEKQNSQEQMQILLAELRGNLLDKTRELEELKLQVKSCISPPPISNFDFMLFYCQNSRWHCK